MANAETNALVGLRKLLPKELFYNTDMDMLGAECEEIHIRAGRNVRFVLRGGEIAGSAVATPIVHPHCRSCKLRVLFCPRSPLSY